MQDTHQRKRTILKQLIKSNIFVILMSVLNSWYNKAQKNEGKFNKRNQRDEQIIYIGYFFVPYSSEIGGISVVFLLKIRLKRGDIGAEPFQI